MSAANSNSTAIPRTTVVVTTIGDGGFLADYHAAVLEAGALESVEFVVIADRKSPAALFDRCREYAARGLNIRVPTLDDQDAFLQKLDLADFVPYDSDNRRNIGYLMAYDNGSDVVISIDDDNYAIPGSRFFAEHAVVAATSTDSIEVQTDNGWFNICAMMDTKPATVYPRGYPYAKRHQASQISERDVSARVRLNAGLWLGEPDLDAMTWLVSPARSTRVTRQSVVLGNRAWSPINTQNTALHRDLIPTYYFAKMNYPLPGVGAIDRYGDILSGYLCQACVRQVGDAIRVGTPAVDHRRNSHHYLRDATHEMGCVWLMEDLCAWLPELRLSGANYFDAYQSLAAAIDEQAEKFRGFIWTDATRGYLHQLAYCMRRWVKACSAINAQTSNLRLAA